jgi:hypothetical protein
LSTHTKLPGEFLPRCRHPAGHGWWWWSGRAGGHMLCCPMWYMAHRQVGP